MRTDADGPLWRIDHEGHNAYENSKNQKKNNEMSNINVCLRSNPPRKKEKKLFVAQNLNHDEK